MKKKSVELKVKARLAFVNLFEAREFNNTKQYSVTLLIPHGNKNAVGNINKAIKEAIELGKERFGWNDGVEKGKNFNIPLDDGDSKAYDGYPGNYFMNTKNKMKPLCIDTDKEPLTPEELYSGCWANCVVHLVPYEHPTGGKGITASIRGVQKYKDDEPFGGSGLSASVFDEGFGNDEDFEGGFLG